jgi:5-methyltetrahydrofolate--homocysteine methyltransferase
LELLESLSKYLEQGDDKKVLELTKQAIEEKVPTKEILDDGLIGGMNVVGERFKNHDIFLPEVLMAAKAMYAGMGELKPLLIEEGIPSIGKVVIGSVKGDLHDIGKNLVGIMLKGAGFEVIDLGNDVSPERFIEAAEQESAGVIGMSALLTTTMSVMRDVVDQVSEKGLTGKIKTIVGGAPVTADFAKDIGADAFGFDGVSAVEEIKRLCNVA